MKKNVFTLLASAALLCACQPAQKNAGTIDIKLDEMKSDTLVVGSYLISDLNQNDLKKDTILPGQTTYTYTAETDSIAYKVFVLSTREPNQGIVLALLPGEQVEITGSLKDWQVAGSPLNATYAPIQKACRPYIEKMDSLEEIMTDDIYRNVYLPTWHQMDSLQADYVRQHPDDDLSLFILGEIGGKWVEEHREMLACDLILVSDTTMISDKVPSINCGMRGLTYVEVEVTGPDKDLHSGHYGGAVLNPLNALCDMISSLIDSKGRITVKGFYDDVVELDHEERAMFARAPFDKQEYMKSIGVDELSGEEGYTTLERTGIRPSLDLNGIWGGYQGEGAKTVIPSTAHAKISMRLVPNQDCHKIAELFASHFRSIAPKGVKVKVTPFHGGNGFLIPVSSRAYKAAEKAVAQVYGVAPVPSRGGGSIPILAQMQGILGVNPLLMGFGLERDTIHSPNESYLISQFFKGMESIALFYEYYNE